MKVLKTFFIILFVISLCISLPTLSTIINTVTFSNPQKSDCIIVLGGQIIDKRPSLTLQYRLEKAVELYNEKYAKYIIVSGGQKKGELYTEASVMKNWLIDKGIPQNVIIQDTTSKNTYENIKYSKDIMGRNSLNTAIIVTSDFHLYRSLRLAKLANIKASGASAKSVRYINVYDYSKEIISVIRSYIYDTF